MPMDSDDDGIEIFDTAELLRRIAAGHFIPAVTPESLAQAEATNRRLAALRRAAGEEPDNAQHPPETRQKRR